MSVIKTSEEIEKIRATGRIVHHVIQETGKNIRPGITTGELEDIAARLIDQAGATSPCLGYSPGGHTPYPAYTCICVNDEIVHGIPGRRVLKEGDIVTIDIAIEYKGYVADSAFTFPVGVISEKTSQLLKITEESMYRGIAQVRHGRRTGDVGHAVQKHAESHGYSVVRELVGHGVGKTMHEEPQVANYGQAGKGEVLKTGMTFTIEPMINSGRRDIRCLDDQWTIVTADGSLSAHFEHTIAVTPNGAAILTNGE